MYDLLTYATGFESPDISSYYSPEYVNKNFPIKDFVKSHMSAVRGLREKRTFMTILVLLAGYAVENVSGMPYSKYMEKTFSPR